MGRKKIIRLNGENYSELLHEFSNSFINDFPEDFDTWEILDFSLESWNIANLRRIVPENEFMDAMRPSEELEETSELFEKMIDYKVKHYSEFNKFILDYDLDLEEESPELEVVTGNIDDYMKVIEEFEDYEEELEENLENRNAIILKPKRIFANWIKMIGEEDEEIYINETKIYLIDGAVFELNDWLVDNFDDLFIRELGEWSFDEDIWPQNRTLAMFRKWFKIDFSTLVCDLESENASKILFDDF